MRLRAPVTTRVVLLWVLAIVGASARAWWDYRSDPPPASESPATEKGDDREDVEDVEIVAGQGEQHREVAPDGGRDAGAGP